MKAARNLAVRCLVLGAFCLLPLTGWAAEAGSEEQKPDMQKLTQQSSNPVGELWMLVNQFNFNLMRSNKGRLFKDDKLQFNWNFQPVLTFDLGETARLVARPVIPIYDSPYRAGRDKLDYKFGLGDAQFMAMLAPLKDINGFLFGAGPTLSMPTATDKNLGSGKWQLGPALAALYMNDKWVVGVFPQHWWSFAGDKSRQDTSFTKAQYFIWYSPAPTWQIGMAPNILINWMEKKAENRWTVPVGLGVSKLVMFGKLPVKLAAEVDYSVVRPQSIRGDEWTFRVSITPIIPKLFPRKAARVIGDKRDPELTEPVSSRYMPQEKREEQTKIVE